MHRRHELPFGAETTARGTRFRLWAPRAKSVLLRLGAGEPAAMPMEREPGGCFSLTTADARPGSRYQYLVDGNAFPDPASRRQPEGVHGPSEVVDPEAYDWQDIRWRGRPWEEVVIYELHLGTFSRSGDFSGALEHLDHVVELGATAIELMPIAEFPGSRDWGYDGVFLYAPAFRAASRYFSMWSTTISDPRGITCRQLPRSSSLTGIRPLGALQSISLDPVAGRYAIFTSIMPSIG
jgi:maltooligosyltrehalose trehalohydrolase